MAGHGARVIVPRGAAKWLAAKGFDRVEELARGEATHVGAVEIRGVKAFHSPRRWPMVGPAARPLGFEVRAASRLYFAGDTELFPEMAELAGRVDLALVPVWGWGLTLGGGHLDPRTAAEAVALIRPRLAVPVHWGTFFPIGRARRHGHLLRDPPREFAAHVAELAPGVEVRVLEPGQSLALSASG
jgi:L-ascorbate metabolism protein UlaG (beta-lactamase superfamily)